jgi:RimJ/RimL family protein N-acetyltransferase
VAITLRTLTDSDLDSLFIWESDPRAIQMAAFMRANPSDRTEFDARYERVSNDPSATLLAIEETRIRRDDRQLDDGRRSSGFLLDRSGPMGTRPRVAGAPCVPCDRADQTALRPRGGHNAASAKVLARAGFVEVGSETSVARGVGEEIVEQIYRLDH